MINKVTSGICTALYNTFGNEYTIYKEEIKQDLKEPCFLVSCYRPNRSKVLNKRYYRQHGMVINYFPKSTNDYRYECNEVLEKLYQTLEYITIDENLVMGRNMRYEFSDGIMIIFIDYDFYTFEGLIKETVMEELIQKRGDVYV